MTERALLANLDAERCVLASLICRAKDCAGALGLSARDFSSYSHGLIYKAIQKLTSAAESTDIIAIMDELGADLDAAGGAAYLGELLNGMYAGPDVVNCVRIIREKAMLREIAILGECAWTANGDASQVLDRVRFLSARIEQEFEQKAKSLPFESANEVSEASERVEWVLKGYVAEGAITVLSAKVKMGKTTLATRLIEAILTNKPFLNARTKRTPVVYLTELAFHSESHSSARI
jgi:replicative DNA helicase